MLKRLACLLTGHKRRAGDIAVTSADGQTYRLFVCSRCGIPGLQVERQSAPSAAPPGPVLAPYTSPLKLKKGEVWREVPAVVGPGGSD